MVPTGLAESLEVLWHFAGYMRLNDGANITALINYEGDARHPLNGDPMSLVRTDFVLPGPDDMYSAPSPVFAVPGPDGFQFHIHIASEPAPRLHGAPMPAFHHYNNLPPLPPLSLDGGGIMSDWSLTVTYQSGGDQEVVNLRQINLLANNDFASVGPIDLHLQPLDNSTMFMTALSEAQGAVAHALAPPDDSQSGLLAFTNTHDVNFQEFQTQDAAYSVQPGQYLNGELQDSSANIHQTADDALGAMSDTLSAGNFAPPAPTGNHFGDHIQDMYLGGNVAANAAVVAGFDGLCGSMVVLGDSYQTQLICQTNVLAQGNWFNVYGHGASASQVTIDPNTVQNAAELKNVGGIDGPWMVGGLPNWDCDVLHGSFFDVKSYVQTNYLTDNDVVGQTQSFGQSEVVAGSNGLINTLDFQNISAQYDLIIVEGSYHCAAMLYQTNVMADITEGWQIGGGSSAGGAVSAGGDMLLNDATIIYQGATGTQAVTSGILDLVHKLDAQNGTLTPSQIDGAFPYLAGSAHVLLITGDYYDVTYLSQTNVICDSNTAAQALLTANGQQSMVAGHDQTINSAIIVHGGSLTTPYVQGHAYSDSMLIQSNIVATDSKVTVNDPNQLAPELVAFTGHDQTLAPADTPQLFGPSDSQHHTDGIAGLMHA